MTSRRQAKDLPIPDGQKVIWTPLIQ